MIINKTPLRISLFGGGTDFPEYFNIHEGIVVGTSIDKFIFHTFSHFSKKLFGKSIRFSYSQIEYADSVDDMLHIPFKEILKYTKINKEIEVNLASDLPSFSGLGSSSSFTVGMLNGLNKYQNKKDLSKKILAEKAIHIERSILNEYVGFQDQIFAAYGGFNIIRFSNNDFEVEKINVSPERFLALNKSLVMVYTGKKRKANEIEKDKFKVLNLEKIDALNSIKKIAIQASNVIQSKKNLDELGELFHESWSLKKSLSSKVSCDEIDEIYSTGIKFGAIGGKILGAGGGGFLLFYVPLKTINDFKKNMSKFYYILDFSFTGDGSSFVKF